RNVYKVAIAYAVIGWLLIQVATQVFPFFEIPNWGIRLVVLIIVMGFPIALILAWAFELTPEGVKRTEIADAAHERSRGSVWIYIVAIGAALSLGFFVVGRHIGRNKETSFAELPEKSLAVLPFANLSGNPENAYFAAGIQDEIITRLAKIGELKVVSCLSTQRFKSSPDDVPAIARQLGVANVLQGSVQRSADAVRVNVQLVKGRYLWNRRTGANLKKAFSYFQQAAEKDPSYALAYTGIADSCALIPVYGAGTPREYYPRAKVAAERALQLDNTLGEAHTSLANAHFRYLQLAESAKEFWRSIELNPNYPTAHQWYGRLTLLASAQFDRALEEAKRAVELDPVSPIGHTDVATVYMTARRYDEAVTQLRNTLAIDPDFYWAHRQ